MASRKTALRGALVGTGLVFGLALAAVPAHAADDGYQNVFSSVLTTVGLMRPDAEPEIDYREHPPLVLPPKMDLPKPAQEAESKNPAWPHDPDVARRKKASAQARAPMEDTFEKNRQLDRVSSKGELLNGRVAETEPMVPGSNQCDNFHYKDRACNIVSPDQLRAENDRFQAANPDKNDKKVLKAGVEPDREYLTQPPSGYRMATKSIEATHEAPEVKQDASNPMSYIREQLNRNNTDE